MDIKTKKVFISYSWTSEDKVLELAQRLMSDGVEIVLDKWDLQPGQDKYIFMETSVSDPKIDKVLLICDKAYQEKANQRKGGVGNETLIISSKIYQSTEQTKFIPIIFEFDEDNQPCLPNYIQSRIYINLSNDEIFEKEYEKLLRDIYEKPEHRKPALGKKPEWLDQEEKDFFPIRNLLKQLKQNENKTSKLSILNRQIIEIISNTLLSFGFKENEDITPYTYMQKIEEQKILRDLLFDYIEVLIENNFEVEENITNLFENLYYSLKKNLAGRSAYQTNTNETLEFFIWESFIGTIAILLYYKKYNIIYQIISHSYYDESNNQFYFYTEFRFYLNYLERSIKPTTEIPNRYSLSADIIVSREKKPIITKENIILADILLWQLSCFSEVILHYTWFPTTYIYDNYSKINRTFWGKIKSKKHCENILPILNFVDIEELKISLKKLEVNSREIRHQNCFEHPLWITEIISIDEIASIN